MKLTSTSFKHNHNIPERCAFGVPDPEQHLRLGENRSPHLAWSELPVRTRSLMLICVDTDVPSSAEDFNKEGRTISPELPRVDFIHWVMIDIAATDGEMAEGECSSQVVAGGKQTPSGPAGSRQGINDFSGFMAGDPEMQGDYYGYDGPCPPWNDALVHHYRFRLYALDIEQLDVSKRFTAAEAIAAAKGHVLDHVELTGLYSLNPELAGQAAER